MVSNGKYQHPCYPKDRGNISIKNLCFFKKDPFYVYLFTALTCAQLYNNLHNSQVHAPGCVFKCISSPVVLLSETTSGVPADTASLRPLKTQTRCRC